jgi:hypothetical protein
MNNKNIHVSGAIVCTHYVLGYQVENQPLSLDIKRYKKILISMRHLSFLLWLCKPKKPFTHQ